MSYKVTEAGKNPHQHPGRDLFTGRAHCADLEYSVSKFRLGAQRETNRTGPIWITISPPGVPA
jgi:hypothetical protein